MSDSDIVQFEARGHIGVITLNRPEAFNSLNGDVANAMEAAIDRLEGERELWGALLTANVEGQERPVFCAGADLKEINAGRSNTLWTKAGGFGGITYKERTKPIIGGGRGPAPAGG